MIEHAAPPAQIGSTNYLVKLRMKGGARNGGGMVWLVRLALEMNMFEAPAK